MNTLAKVVVQCAIATELTVSPTFADPIVQAETEGVENATNYEIDRARDMVISTWNCSLYADFADFDDAEIKRLFDLGNANIEKATEKDLGIQMSNPHNRLFRISFPPGEFSHGVIYGKILGRQYAFFEEMKPEKARSVAADLYDEQNCALLD